MPNIEGSISKYIPKKYVWIFERFSLEELETLLTDGRTLFEYMSETKKSKDLLEYNKKLAHVIGKW